MQMLREGTKNDLVRQCIFVHAVEYWHIRDATQRRQFGALTPLSCIATLICRILSNMEPSMLLFYVI